MPSQLLSIRVSQRWKAISLSFGFFYHIPVGIIPTSKELLACKLFGHVHKWRNRHIPWFNLSISPCNCIWPWNWNEQDKWFIPRYLYAQNVTRWGCWLGLDLGNPFRNNPINLRVRKE